VDERELAEVIDQYHPAVRYRSFDEAFVKKERWPAYATKEVMERQAHPCVSIEVVVAHPTKETYTKMNKRGGVAVQVRRTVCGESHLIMTELSREDFGTKTGFTVKGKPVGGPDGQEPLPRLTLSDLIYADEFINANNESGSQLMLWFREHAASSKHRGGHVKRVGHHDTHMGMLADGGSPRHRVRSARSGARVVLRVCMLPRSGIQGGTYPSKESALLAIGQVQDLVSASLFLLKKRRVEVSVVVDDNGRRQRTRQILRLTAVAKVSLAMV
jgi:hypothetical protein